MYKRQLRQDRLLISLALCNNANATLCEISLRRSEMLPPDYEKQAPIRKTPVYDCIQNEHTCCHYIKALTDQTNAFRVLRAKST